MTAAAEQGFRIMTMLYLTPIMPLGPISYMCGTTSMALSSFLTAKIASLPLKLLYAVIGGSAVGSAGALVSNSDEDGAAGDELKDIQENRSLIVSGILFSFVMIAWITHYTKKELNKVRCVVFHVLERFTTSILSLSPLTHTFLLYCRFWTGKRITNRAKLFTSMTSMRKSS
jgi:uncharacterized membrane protein YdjX (TVP38/TMEM64 family)